MSRPAITGRNCPLCGSADAAAEIRSPVPAEAEDMAALEPFWFGIEKARRFFTYHRCRDCGLLYNRDFFDEAQLAALYSSMPPNMDVVGDDAIAATQKGYFDAVAALGLLGGDYLEIGPDVGHIVRQAATRGRFGRFWLMEPNRAVHDVLRAAADGRPATILPDMMDLSAVPDGTVGLAVMVHVLDHLLDPRAMLAAIRAKLREDGVLMIVTHDEGSALRRLLGARWPAFCLQHPELYNPETIRRLLERAGYAAVTVRRSTNHFPIDFLGRQAAQAIGLRFKRLPLPRRAVALRLGNILTLAAPGQAAAEGAPARFESAA